jgi:histidyl-tRNA synthetase
LEKNPLRLLDCKVKTCREKMQSAPSLIDSLGERSKEQFEAVQQALQTLGVPFEIDSGLVRGLDYYTGPVFEITANRDELGNQSTIVAGGRYDNLVESLGGPATPAAGFALGIERAIMSFGGPAEEYAAKPHVFVVSRGDAARAAKLSVAAELRQAGLVVDLDHRQSSMKAQFKRADKLGAQFVITLGDDEIESGTVMLKNMQERSEESVARGELLKRLSHLV